MSPPVVIIAGVLRLSCRRGVCVIGHWSSAPPLNEGNCRRVRCCCAAEVPVVPAGVVMFRARRVSLISLFYSTSHFPSYYQLYELETDNKLRGRRRPHISCLVLPTHLPSTFRVSSAPWLVIFGILALGQTSENFFDTDPAANLARQETYLCIFAASDLCLCMHYFLSFVYLVDVFLRKFNSNSRKIRT